MSIRVHLGGRICTPEEARISVFDRGFLYGDSVYETIGTVGGRLYGLAEHLDRLERSADRVGLILPPRSLIHEAVRQTVVAAANQETRVRIIVTRGAGKVDLDPASADDPQLVVIATPLEPLPASAYEKGVAVEIVSVTRNSPRAIDPSVKSGNFLNNVLALREARRRRPDAHEAILCNTEGFVAEASTSNIFAVVGDEVRTPSLAAGILAGITRDKVLALARAEGVPCREVDAMRPDDLRAANEVFLTSTTRGVLPVTRIDGRPVGSGAPGPVTGRLRDLYDRMTRMGGP